jgi:hypothetical protein
MSLPENFEINNPNFENELLNIFEPDEFDLPRFNNFILFIGQQQNFNLQLYSAAQEMYKTKKNLLNFIITA